jgi:kinetochore protein Spc7/SPC105
LAAECDRLQIHAKELADCDPAELEAARNELIEAEEDIKSKETAIADLVRELRETEKSIEEATLQKQQALHEMHEAEKIREECRGWTTAEITCLKGKILRAIRQATLHGPKANL